MPDDHLSPWGTFAPPASAALLILLKKIGISRGWVRKWILRKWKALNLPLVDTTVHGIRYRLDIDGNTTDGKILTSSRHYDKQEIDALSLAGDDPLAVFVDIGANTGYYSLTMAKAGYRRVLAIEPNPPTLQRLRFNVACNGYEEVIQIVPSCVGATGKVPFYFTGDMGSASLFNPGDDTEPVWVESVPLATILHDHEIERIDALKIDVEGYEDRVLIPFFESAPEALWPRKLVMEDCNRHLWEKDLIGILTGSGFVIDSKTRGNVILSYHK